MAEIHDYVSTPKYETFSYLPPLTPEKNPQSDKLSHQAGLESGNRARRTRSRRCLFLVHVEAAHVWRAIG